MILTDEEICQAIGAKLVSERWRKDAEALIAAVVAKLAAGVSVEPDAMYRLRELYTSPPDHTAAMRLALEAMARYQRKRDDWETFAEAIAALEKELGE